MSQEISFETVDSEQVAGIAFSTTLATLSTDLDATINRLFHQLSDTGVTPHGPVIVVYTDEMRTDSRWKCEVCTPITRAISGHPVLITHELPGGLVATVTHTGPYNGLKATYDQIFDWFTAYGHTYAGPPREIYLNSPAEVADDELLTRIEFPCVASIRSTNPRMPATA
ncbi:GyrI-like domain-containing protein [Salinibacterium sp. TMP30]|uniref:GyrI-like domain-containing protein n=1 Tax=Salinibacterium sp. TMP30 TaxID=3138237 RepID=UPI00313896B0